MGGLFSGLFGGGNTISVPGLSARDIIKESSSATPVSPLFGSEKKVGTTGKDALLIDLDSASRSVKTQVDTSMGTSTTFLNGGIGSQE